MDLTNLTLDDLLSQIKADSSYKEPKPAEKPTQIFVPEVQAVEPPVKAEKPESFSFDSEPAEAFFSEPPTVDEPSPQQAFPEPVAYEEEPESEPDTFNFDVTEKDPADTYAYNFRIEEESNEPYVFNFERFKEEKSYFYNPVVEEEMSVSEQQSEPSKEEAGNFLSIELEEEQFNEAPDFYAAAVPGPSESIEIIEEPTFEPANLFEPQYAFKETMPLEIEDTENSEPTIEPEPQKPEETESFKIFGNINLDADMAAFFPEIDQASSPQADTPVRAEEKTIVLEQFTDKTAVFERPGILTGKNLFEKTADLSAVPTIISADDALKDKFFSDQKTFIRTGAIPIVPTTVQQPIHQEPDDGQMILPGFGIPEEPVAQVDETAVENELRRTRSKKVDSFKLEGVEPEEPQFDEEAVSELTENTRAKRKRFSNTKTRTRLNRQPVEYRKPNDKPQVFGFIRSKRLSALIAVIISGICTVALIITTAIPSVAQSINNSSSSFSVTAVLSLALLIVAFVATLPCCCAGISCFFNGSGKPNAQTPAVIAAIAAILQSLVAVIFSSDSEFPLFAAAATLVLCLNACGKLISFNRISANFEFIANKSKSELYTVKTIENTVDANKIGKNVVMGDADIRYSSKTKFVSNFLAYSMASDAADDLCTRLVPIVAAASALIGVIAGITTKNAICGIGLFTGAMCMGAPASAIIAANLPLSRANKKLRKNGGIITGYAGAFEYESTNAVALDAADIFPGHCCNIHGMKTFYGIRMDDAILTAASMLITSGGPISSLFNEVVMGRKELLMNVEDIAYEDRLGLSGWVRGRRVFVGNRKLLENHNIEIPVSVDEAKYRHDGRRVIYLADAGKIAAIFVVSYGTEPETVNYLRKIESSGINLLIRSMDSNITEEFVANAFGLPLNSVKIVNPNAAEIFKSYADAVSSKDDAKLVHCGKASSFLQCINAANILCWAAGVISTQQTFCCAAGLLLLAGMVLFSGAATVTAIQICLCQLVWLGIGIIVPLINKE